MNDLLQLIKICVNFFQQYAGTVLVFLGVFGVGIELTPWIKVNPVKAIFGFIGKKYGAYLKEVFKESTKEISDKIDEQGKQIDELKVDVEQIKSDNLSKELYDMRWEILDFNNAQNDRDYNEEMYNHIIDVHDRYERKIKENNLVNGRVDLAYAHILEMYKQKFN